ncbi:MAG: hypothetical protein PHF63_03905 [Herbinix sp.]|nr:hypothetical protein [Herbinix sp.]
MANKKNNSSNKPEKVFIDLLYMTSSEVSAKDIALLLQDTKEISVQLWEEMNVLELELANQNSVDFELLEATFKDPSDAAFIKNRNIKTIFSINLCKDDLDTVISYFEKIISTYSGFLCADSEDFTPVYAGTSKK